MFDQILTPAFYAIIGPLLIAAVVFWRDWLAKNSAKTTQEALRLTLENINLNADIAARKAEIAANEAETVRKAQRDQAETFTVQALILGKVAQDTADTKVIQAATGAKVDGQMTALNEKIAELSSALKAEKQAGITEKEKAATLAVQTEKDRGEAAAKLAAAQHAPASPRIPRQADPEPGTETAIQGQAVTIPEITVAVEEAKPAPLIVTP